MKKILLPTLFLFAAFSLQAQTVSDFENVKLPEGTPYWNGVDMGDGVDYDATISYKSGASMFPMSTSVSYGYGNLSGFVLSQATDTEAMSANAPYSSIKGSGADGSSKYAVCVIDPSKDLPIVTVAGEYDDARVVSGCYISPTTDLPYYLENGRGFMDRNPYAEGDWLAVVATGYDAAGNATGTATIYLADYRDAGKADKWLKDWEWFDLTSLGAVKKISFGLSASENHVRSYNNQVLTTTSFCMDNFEGTSPTPSAIKANATKKTVRMQSYFTEDGKQIRQLRPGVNVVKTVFTDGTTSIEKVVK